METALYALYVIATHLAGGTTVRLVTLGLRPACYGPSSVDVPADDVPYYVNGSAADAARYGYAVYLAHVPEGFRYHASWENQNRHEVINNETGAALEIAGDRVFV